MVPKLKFLCSPIAFAKEVRGAISIAISMRPVHCLSKRTPTSKQDRAERLPSVLVLEWILMCEALPPTLAKEHTQFTVRWYSACKHGSKKHRNTWRNAAHCFVWNLVVSAGMSTLPKFRLNISRIFVILEVILVVLVVQTPIWTPRGLKVP